MKPSPLWYLVVIIVTICCTVNYHYQNTPKETPKEKENVLEVVFSERIAGHGDSITEIRNKQTGERFLVSPYHIVQIKEAD
jgi:hypothetical protein